MSLKQFIGRNIIAPLRTGRFLRIVAAMPRLFSQWKKYVGMTSEVVRRIDWYLQVGDATGTTPFDAHYFYQSAWAARKIAQHRPVLHVDIGSQIDLLAPLSGFVDVEFVDIRPLEVSLSGFRNVKGSILDLPYADQSVHSLSCLHVVEHIGLGRYGDELDARGTWKACKELQRVLSKEGQLYLSTPVGRERVEFNAHRIHSPATILQLFDELHLADFASVDDQGLFKANAKPEDCLNCSYGLGMFQFTRL